MRTYRSVLAVPPLLLAEPLSAAAPVRQQLVRLAVRPTVRRQPLHLRGGEIADILSAHVGLMRCRRPSEAGVCPAAAAALAACLAPLSSRGPARRPQGGTRGKATGGASSGASAVGPGLPRAHVRCDGARRAGCREAGARAQLLPMQRARERRGHHGHQRGAILVSVGAARLL